MIYFEEKYDIPLPMINEFLKFAEEFPKAIKKMNLPYIKGWSMYQSKYQMGRFIEVWTIEEQANVDQLFQEASTNPHFKHIPPKFFEYVVNGSHQIAFYTKLLST